MGMTRAVPDLIVNESTAILGWEDRQGVQKVTPCQVVRWQCDRYVLSVRPFLAHRRRRRLPFIMISVDGSLAVLLRD